MNTKAQKKLTVRAVKPQRRQGNLPLIEGAPIRIVGAKNVRNRLLAEARRALDNLSGGCHADQWRAAFVGLCHEKRARWWLMQGNKDGYSVLHEQVLMAHHRSSLP